MVGNEFNGGGTFLSPNGKDTSMKSNGSGPCDGYLEESPTKHAGDNRTLGNP